jgi:hypothetical protein
MPVLKINSSKYEVLLFKHKRAFITILICLALLIIAVTFFFLLSLGLIFNKEVSEVDFSISDYSVTPTTSILTNQEFTIVNNKSKVKIYTKNTVNSIAMLVDNNEKVIAIDDTFDKKISFSNKNTLINLSIYSPYFSFLDVKYKAELKDYLNKLNIDKFVDEAKNISIDDLIESQIYSSFLDTIAADSEVQGIIKKYYTTIQKNSLPGYLNTNKVYPWSFQMDNYQSSYPSKFNSNFGLEIVNDKFTPRVNNTATFFQNLIIVDKNSELKNPNDLLAKDNISYQAEQLFTPTLLDTNSNINISQMEELKLPENFPNQINEYNLLSSQISMNNNVSSAFSYNVSEYLKNIFADIKNNNIKQSNENLDKVVDGTISVCKDNPSIILKCFISSFSDKVKDRFQYEKNSTNILYIDFLTTKIFKQLSIPTKFFGKYNTSPMATARYFIDNSNTIKSDIKLKVPISQIDLKIGKNNFSYDGSFEKTTELNNEETASITFNKKDLIVEMLISNIKNREFFCSNDLDLIKLDNSLYKSQRAVWNGKNLELDPTITNYYKVDNKYFASNQNVKVTGIYKVLEVEAGNYRNCFNAENLGTIYKDLLIKISAKKIDQSKFTEDENALLDNFISGIVIDRK